MKKSNSTLNLNNRENPYITDSLDLLTKAGFQEDECEEFAEKAVGVLDDCRDHFGEGYEFEYSAGRRFGRIELKIRIPGERFNPFEDGSGAKRRSVEKVLCRQLRDKTATVYYSYAAGYNIISVYSSEIRHKEFAVRSPILWALILGLLAGLLCRSLPEGISRFLREDVADPIFSVTIGMMTGIMGPVMFISMVIAISSLDSIGKLTDLGGKIFRRFIRCTLFTMGISIIVALCFYHVFSVEGADFSSGQIIRLLLDVFPTNIVKPFIENNTPQLVVMGAAMGTALLMLGENAAELNRSLNRVSDWLRNTVRIIYILTPVIPFLSIFRAIAAGQGSVLLNGWEFVVAIYISLTLCIMFKLMKVSARCRIPASVLWKKAKPLFSRSFATGSESATMMLEYEVSRDSMGINPSFSAFWIPMSQAMLSIKTVVPLTIPPFLISKYTGMPITLSFLLVLVILTLELSIASPGIQSAWVILFASLTLPPEYVGIFAVYKILTTNYGSACSMLYAALEQIEVSHVMGELDRTYYEENSRPGSG